MIKAMSEIRKHVFAYYRDVPSSAGQRLHIAFVLCSG